MTLHFNYLILKMVQQLLAYGCWLIVFLLSLCVYAKPIAANEVTNSDPRFLSQIAIPMLRNCATDVSNDGLHLYAVCDSAPQADGVTPSGPAVLYIYDISDLHNPRQQSKTNIAQISGYNLIVRNATAFYQETLNKGIDLIDVSDADHPTLASHISTSGSYQFRLSDDGHFLVQKDYTTYNVWDITDVHVPKEVPFNNVASTIATVPVKWQIADSAIIKGLPGNRNIYDARANEVLVSSTIVAGLTELYDLSNVDKPHLVANFPGNGGLIIPGKHAVVFKEEKAGNEILTLSRASNLDFTVEHLHTVYDAVIAKYLQCKDDTDNTNACNDLRNKSLAWLKDAGIDRLLGMEIDGITHGQRIEMLNNYGFWIYKWQPNSEGFQKSIEILKKVNDLAPHRDIAWLNLGDSLRAMIPLATSDSQKATFWKDAMHAYDRYSSLSGKKASGAVDLRVFDLPAVLASSRNVCSYTASAINYKQLDVIASPKGTITLDGLDTNFAVGSSGGTCWSDAIQPEQCHIQNDCIGVALKLRGLQLADSEEGSMGNRGMKIVPFRGKYFVVTNGENQVVDVDTGPVCRLRHDYQSALTQNDAPSICETFLVGKLSNAVNWQDIKSEQHNDVQLSSLRQTVNIDLKNNQSLQIGKYGFSSGSGCGCDESGILIFHDGKVLSPDSEPGKSLTYYEQKFSHCGVAEAHLVDGELYIDLQGRETNIGTNSRVLLRYADNKFYPICRVDNVLKVTPIKNIPEP